MTKISKTTHRKLQLYRDYLSTKIYRHPIVSIEEFVSNPYYLGTSFSGGKTLFRCWRKTLKDIFLDDSRYLVVLTGSTSIGKTVCAMTALAYTLYRHLEMHNIWEFYGMSDGGKVSIAFFNLTKTLAASKGFETFQNFIIKSEYFRSRGTVKGSTRENPDGVKIEFPEVNLLLCSPSSAGFNSVGHHIIAAVMDEVDSPNATKNSQHKIIDAFENTVLRLEGRFLKHDKTPGRFFLVSSKQENLSFLNTYIKKMQTSTTHSKRIIVADYPRWEAYPESDYSGKKFQVSCGDMFNTPRIIRDSSDINTANEKNFRVIDVPMEYYGDFEMDCIKSLRDIAGISAEAIAKSRLFTNASLLDTCWASRPNPVQVQTIDIGLNDPFELIDFIDFSKIQINKDVPRFIHTDIAFTEDALCVAMACKYGSIDVTKQLEDGTLGVMKAPVAYVDFILRIKAREGDRIPLHKIRRLILDLKNRGFNISQYSSDLRLAAEDTFQLLNNAGINTKYFSMDQPINNYLEFRDIVIEKRFNCFRHDYLKIELAYLEYDRAGKGKIDHPIQIKDVQYAENGDLKETVIDGSKDVADAVSAACLNAIRNTVNPMDGEFMTSLITGSNEVISPIDSALKHIMPKSSEGIQVISSGDDYNQFNDILKGLL